jgi:drug/metabolite transporter (DMT)-like permease
VYLPGILLGSTLVMTRFGLGQFAPQVFVAMRLSGAALMFLVVYLLFRYRAWPKSPSLWLRAGLFGIIGSAITMSAYTNSMRFQSSGVTSLLATLSPIVTVLMAHFFLKDEPLDVWRLAGALIAFFGAGILLVRGESGLADLARADWRGYAFALLGMTCNAAGLVFARRYLRFEDPFVVTSIRILVGATAVTILAGINPGFDFSNVRLTGVLALAYASVVGTFLAFLFYLMSVQRFGATAASQSEYLVPLAATGLGVLILGERVTPTMLAGMVCIFLGLAVYERGSWLKFIPGLHYFFQKTTRAKEN